MKYKKLENVMRECIGIRTNGLWCLVDGIKCKNLLKHRNLILNAEIEIRPKGNNVINWKRLKRVLLWERKEE